MRIRKSVYNIPRYPRTIRSQHSIRVILTGAKLSRRDSKTIPSLCVRDTRVVGERNTLRNIQNVSERFRAVRWVDLVLNQA